MTTTLASEPRRPRPARTEPPSLELASYGDRVFRCAADPRRRSRSRSCSASWSSSSGSGSRLAIDKFGLDFVTTSTWDPVAEQFGAFPLIFGTLISSLVALVIAVPLSLGVAIYLTEFAPKVDPAAGRLPDQPARRDSERGLRPLGHLRPDPDSPDQRLPVPP